MLDINNVPFFANKEITIQHNTYSDDMFPSCFLITDYCGDYKVRLFSQFNSLSIIREHKVLQYLSENGITSCPQIIEAKIDGDSESDYLVESFLSGMSLEKYSEAELKKHIPFMIKELASLLIKLHSLHGDGFHRFTNQNYESYTDMLIIQMNNHIDFISSYDYSFSKQLFKFINVLSDYKVSMDNIIPTFLHFDLKPQNIIFDLKTLKIGIIDFEHSRFGDPYHEIIRTRLRFKQKGSLFMQNFWKEIEQDYIIRINANITTERELIYELYYYIAELPYLFKTNNSATIKTYYNSINNLFGHLHNS